MSTVAAQLPRCATLDLRTKTDVPPRQITVVHISDTHDTFYTNIPEGDILIHSGDFTNWGTVDETKRFNAFLRSLPHSHKIIVAGNHEIGYDSANRDQIQKDMFAGVSGNCYLLHDAYCDVLGLRIHGSSWNNIETMAFGASEPFRKVCWQKITSGVHLLVTHQPAYEVFDAVFCGDDVPPIRWGCPSLRKRIEELKIPLHMCGHVHEDAGLRKVGETLFSNAAMQDFQRPNVITVLVDTSMENVTRSDSTFIEDDADAVHKAVFDVPPAVVPAAPTAATQLTKFVGFLSVANPHLWSRGASPVMQLFTNSNSPSSEWGVQLLPAATIKIPHQSFNVYTKKDGSCAIISTIVASTEGIVLALTAEAPEPNNPWLPYVEAQKKLTVRVKPVQRLEDAFVWTMYSARGLGTPEITGFSVVELHSKAIDTYLLTDPSLAVGWGTQHSVQLTDTPSHSAVRSWVLPYTTVEVVDQDAENEKIFSSSVVPRPTVAAAEPRPAIINVSRQFSGVLTLADRARWIRNAAPVLDVDVRRDPSLSELCLWKELSPTPQNQSWHILADSNCLAAIVSRLPSPHGASSQVALTVKPNARGQLRLTCASYAESQFNDMFQWQLDQLSPSTLGPEFQQSAVARLTHVETGAVLNGQECAGIGNVTLVPTATVATHLPSSACALWVLPKYLSWRGL